jgi:uncharacterized protein (TIGR00725 family)
MERMKRRIGVIGAGLCNPEIEEVAEDIGRMVAERGAILYSGGLGGIMEAASRGAAGEGGITVGILPGKKASDANPHIKIPVVTGMGHARNVVLVNSCEVLIAISGAHGTLSEIALALKMWKPVVGIHTWKDIKGVHYVDTAEAAVEKAFSLLP